MRSGFTANSGADGLGRLYRQALRASWLGLAVNAGLALLKLAAGILGHSIAMIADAVNSLGDALTSIVIIYALKVAQRPADREHPYGHSRAEAIAALAVAMLIGISALAVALEAVRGFAALHALPPLWLLGVAAFNVVIKEGIYQYKRRVASRTGSQALVAGAWDHRCDALSSLAVLIGLAIVHFAGARLIWADDLAALVVVGFILVTAVRLFRRNASLLMDEQSEPELLEEITRQALATPGVAAVEQVRARRSGLEIFVDIHVEVDAQLTVAEGHRIGHDVQERIIADVTAVSQVLVHIEPNPHPAHGRDQPADQRQDRRGDAAAESGQRC
jgi:cation diffusion facilitator family transporter